MSLYKIYLDSGNIVVQSFGSLPSGYPSTAVKPPAQIFPVGGYLTCTQVGSTSNVSITNAEGSYIFFDKLYSDFRLGSGNATAGSVSALISLLNGAAYFGAATLESKLVTEVAKITALENATKTSAGDRGVFVNNSKGTTESHISVTTTAAKLQAAEFTRLSFTENSGPGTATVSVAAGTSGNEAALTALTIAGSSTAAIADVDITAQFFVNGRADNAPGFIALREAADNGTHFMGLKAPASVTASVTLELPNGTGSNGQALITDGSGVLSFADVAGIAAVVNDTAPQLGGDLDVNGSKITSVSSGEVLLEPDASGVTRIANPNGNTTVLKLGGNTNSGGTIHLDFKHHTAANNAGASIRSSGGHYGTGQLSFYAKGTNTSDGADLVADNLIAKMSYNGGLEVYKNFSVLGGDLQFGHVGSVTTAEKRLGVKTDEPNSTQSSLHLEAGNANYSNRGGGNLRLKAGAGSGSGDSGVISFWACEGIAASGTTNTNLERMRLSPEGYLGIGTTSPSEALDVAGNITVTGTVDGVDIGSLNTAVTANTAKTGITSNQALAITANTAKGIFVSDDVGGVANATFEAINGISANAGLIVSMLQDTTADNTNANSKDFLGVVSSVSDIGVINGLVEITGQVPNGATVGRPLWLGTSGTFISAAPTATDSYARVVGHYIGPISQGTYGVFFNPSNDWIQID